MSQQLSLLMGARNSDPATSHAANATAPRHSMFAVIFDLMTLRSDGATADELLAAWPSEPKPQRSVVSKRLSELHALGHLRVVGTRPNERNREVSVYVLVRAA